MCLNFLQQCLRKVAVEVENLLFRIGWLVEVELLQQLVMPLEEVQVETLIVVLLVEVTTKRGEELN